MSKIRPHNFIEEACIEIATGVDKASLPAEKTHSLGLSTYRLQQGAELTLPGCASGFALYIWKGELQVEGQSLAAGTSITADSQRQLTVRASADSEILYFESEAAALNAGRDSIFVCSGEQAARHPDNYLGQHALLSDCRRDGTNSWLHITEVFAGNSVPLHFHTEDEVIFIIEGEMHFGSKVFGEGTALAIDKEGKYQFTAGPQGLAFVNYRAASPTIVIFNEGEPSDVFDEAEVLRSLHA